MCVIEPLMRLWAMALGTCLATKSIDGSTNDRPPGIDQRLRRRQDLHDHPTRGQSGDHDSTFYAVGDLVTLATPRSTTAYVYDPRIGASGVLRCSPQHLHMPRSTRVSRSVG